MAENIEILDIPISTTASPTYIKVGDTIPAISFTFDSGIDLTTCTIKMQVYDKLTKLLDISSASGITISDALNFTIDAIPAVSNPFTKEGIYIGDLVITDASNVVKTYFNVRYTIIKSYTVKTYTT